MNNVLRIEDTNNYLREDEPFTTVSGYVAKYDDVEKIGTDYSDIREALRLDYKDTNGGYPYPEDGNSYAVIRFKYDNVTDDLIDIPYGEGFYGTNTDPAPCTQNGFLGGRNDTIVPEWKVTDYTKATIQEGAKMYKVTNGKEELLAIFKDGRFRKVN